MFNLINSLPGLLRYSLESNPDQSSSFEPSQLIRIDRVPDRSATYFLGETAQSSNARHIPIVWLKSSFESDG